MLAAKSLPSRCLSAAPNLICFKNNSSLHIASGHRNISFSRRLSVVAEEIAMSAARAARYRRLALQERDKEKSAFIDYWQMRRSEASCARLTDLPCRPTRKTRQTNLQNDRTSPCRPALDARERNPKPLSCRLYTGMVSGDCAAR
jgi:hypothetical protein